MNNKGVLIIMSGPSGAGKGTICRQLLERHDDLFLSVSATTRDPRQGEVQGVNYYFLTKEEFRAKIEEGDFLEWAEVYGNYYGTPKSKVQKMLDEGKNVILEIDIQGALKVKENCTDGVFIFILPPSMEELKHRITNRGSETPESLLERFNSAYKEINYISRYNYGVVNDTVEAAVNKVENILVSELCRVDRMNLNIFNLKEDKNNE